ncbi:response regulator [Enterobacteriaceae bacterium LUAb1]
MESACSELSSHRKKIKIAIIDNQKLVAEGLAKILDSYEDFLLAGIYHTSQSLLTSLKHHPVDIILLDYSLSPQEIDGQRLIQKLCRLHPESPLVIISSEYNLVAITQAFRSGARAFVGKHMSPTLLYEAIHTVHKGKWWLEPKIAAQYFALNVVPKDSCADISSAAQLLQLTTSEQEVIRCLLWGMTVTEVASKFSKSVKTISGQKQSAFKKLGIKKNQELYMRYSSKLIR